MFLQAAAVALCQLSRRGLSKRRQLLFCLHGYRLLLLQRVPVSLLLRLLLHKLLQRLPILCCQAAVDSRLNNSMAQDALLAVCGVVRQVLRRWRVLQPGNSNGIQHNGGTLVAEPGAYREPTQGAAVEQLAHSCTCGCSDYFDVPGARCRTWLWRNRLPAQQ
jgi:hypothetical protein